MTTKKIFVFLVFFIISFGAFDACTPQALQEPSPLNGEINPSSSPSFTKSSTQVIPQLNSQDAAKTQNPGLTDNQIATLASLERVDPHPLYVMHYYAHYDQVASGPYTRVFNKFNKSQSYAAIDAFSWSCTLFTALGEEKNMLYGRNFDWEFSPAVLLFTHPENGYASVSMVDIAYLGFNNDKAGDLVNLSLEERTPLLSAPFLPFDGMNEHGLVVGMAAVPPGHMPSDPEKTTIDSLLVMREVLDQARRVDEAIEIINRYNIDWGSGPPLHYLVADRSGHASLLEFHQGRVNIIPNIEPWHMATNFLVSSTASSPDGHCWRYDRIEKNLKQEQGRISFQTALDLLSQVSQDSTQWSIVYGITSGEITVVMGKDYNNPHHFQLGDF